MYIITNLGIDFREPSGGWLKIMTVGKFVRYDFQTCARRFLRNCWAELPDFMHATSMLVVVDVHNAKFSIAPQGATLWQSENIGGRCIHASCIILCLVSHVNIDGSIWQLHHSY